MHPRYLRPRAVVGTAVATGVLLGALTACGGTAAGGEFVTGSAAYPLSCMQHQAHGPDRVYTNEAEADTAQILAMLKYYTANKGVTKYCDGKAPDSLDQRWAQAYVALGAEPQNVAHILNSRS